MNEDYLKQFRKLPDASLVEKIQSRLERKARKQTVKRYSIFSMLALMFLFSMFILFSSPAHAEILYTLTKPQVIKCIFFSDKLENEIKEKGYVTISDFESFIQTYSTTDCDSGDGVLTPEQGLYVPLEYLSLNDAQVRFISPNALPTYVPQGFERLANVELFDLPGQPTLVVTWNRQNHYSLIKLLISHHSFEIKEYAQTLGKGAIEETVLDGKPAIIVRGVWNIGVQENDFMMTALMWRYDENTVYSLLSLEQAVPLDELLKMAESIP